MKSLFLALLSIFGMQFVVPPASAADSNIYAWLPVIYQMCQIQILLVRNRASLSPDAAPLTDVEKTQMIVWLRNINFQALPEPAKSDCETWRKEVLSFLMSPPTSLFEQGHQLAQIQSRFLVPILIDFEINRSQAILDLQKYSEFQYPHILADAIGTILDLEKAVFLIGCGFPVKCPPEAKPAACAFVTYQIIAIYMLGMAQEERRPVNVQAALLAMDPTTVFRETGCSYFKVIHEILCIASREINKKKFKEAVDLIVDLGYYFALLLKEAALTDADIVQAGGESLLSTIQYYRRLIK